jgi:hypothetical protein
LVDAIIGEETSFIKTVVASLGELVTRRRRRLRLALVRPATTVKCVVPNGIWRDPHAPCEWPELTGLPAVDEHSF